MVGSGEKGVKRKNDFWVCCDFLCEEIGKSVESDRIWNKEQGGCRPEVKLGRYLIAF